MLNYKLVVLAFLLPLFIYSEANSKTLATSNTQPTNYQINYDALIVAITSMLMEDTRGLQVNEGRLLAANCAQCHGTNGVSVNGWDSIAEEKELLEEFYEDEHPLMSAIAHGFNRDEVAKMGSWLSTLSKGSEKDDDKDDDNDNDDDKDDD